MKNRSDLDRIGYLTLLITAAALLFHWQPARAASVTLAWDGNLPAPDGYRIFQRVEGLSYDYTSPVWPLDDSDHTETTCTIDGLTEGVTYYFVVRAYSGPDDSGDSNEVQFQSSATALPEADSGSGEIGGGTDGSADPTPIEENDGAATDTPEVGSGEVDSGTDGGVDPTPIEENDGIATDTPEDNSGEAGNDTEGSAESTPAEENADADLSTPDDGSGPPDSDADADLPTPVPPGYGDEYPPSLEILDNNFAHLSWLSLQWRENVPADTQSRIAMGDIDGDGRDEMVIGLGQVYDALLPGGLFQIVDDDYTLLGWGQIDWPDYNLANGESYPSCGDIDGDGDDEIFLGLGDGGQGLVEVLDFQNGSAVHLDWITVDWPEYNASLGQTHPAAGDIDNDGKDEIIIGLGNVASDPQVPGGLFQVLDDDFSELSWGEIDWPEYNENRGESYPTAGDMNGDGKSSILIGLGPGGGGRVEAFRYDAGIVTHTGWISVDWDAYNQTAGQTRPVCGDVDGDGREEIVVGLGANPNDPDIPGGRFQIIDDDATHLAWVQIQWPAYNALNGESYPVAGDINGDGIDDIFVGLGIQNAQAADESQPPIDVSPDPATDSESEGGGSGGGGSGCFIRTARP